MVVHFFRKYGVILLYIKISVTATIDLLDEKVEFVYICSSKSAILLNMCTLSYPSKQHKWEDWVIVLLDLVRRTASFLGYVFRSVGFLEAIATRRKWN